MITRFKKDFIYEFKQPDQTGEEMKIFSKKLMIITVMSFGLSGCLTETTIPEQMTEFNVGCDREEMQITEDSIELNGERSWKVECRGKKYYCTYLEESSSDCYEISK